MIGGISPEVMKLIPEETRAARSLVKIELEVHQVGSVDQYNMFCMTAHFADGHKMESSVRILGDAKTPELFSRLWQGLKYKASDEGYFPWVKVKP